MIDALPGIQKMVAGSASLAAVHLRSCPYQPMEFNVVVELDPAEEKTKGGIIILDTAKERDQLAAEEGTLVAVSPHAFTYADDWPADYPPPQVGQRVMLKRYQGVLREKEIGGVKRSFRIVADKDIVAVIPPAEGGE